jgi:hypothetical protein
MQPLPIWIWVAAATVAALGLRSANPLLTAFAVLVLPTVAQLLWRRGEPPALVFACAMQWLQAAAAVFLTNYYGISMTQAFGSPQLETATWLSLITILVLAAGMRLPLMHRAGSRQKLIEREGAEINLRKAFLAYVISYIIGTGLNSYAWIVPGLTQLLLPLAAIKWIFVFILAYSVLEQRRGYFLLAILVLFEVATGFLGYFAGFKGVFFIVTVATLASPLAMDARRLSLLLLVFCCLLAFGIFWSAIKMEYREYLNEGATQQAVVVPLEERANKLGELVDKFTWADFNAGLDAMVLRVSYVHYFALAIINVPDAVPYENGALWWGTLKHSLMPRLFFPNKPILDDSERTRIYTGMVVSGTEADTSIGIGYIGESYIDFGPKGMFAPIALLGVFYGLIYRIFAIRNHRVLLGSAVASTILVFGAYTIETSNVKLVGGNLVAVLVLGGLDLMLGKSLHRWLSS